MTELAKLLADCDARGIRLHHAGDGGLTIDAPQTDLTPDMVARLKTHKDELLTLLLPRPDVALVPPVATADAPANPERIGSCVDVDRPCLWDEATEPGPACPVCGSLEQWQDLLGQQRCGVCEDGILNKALQLAQRAAHLRKQTQQQKLASQDNAGDVSGGMVDTQTSGTIGPCKGNQRALAGCKTGQGDVAKGC